MTASTERRSCGTQASHRSAWRGRPRAAGSTVGPTSTSRPTASGWRTAASVATWQPKEFARIATRSWPAARAAATTASASVLSVGGVRAPLRP
jgi:hypothetical protein